MKRFPTIFLQTLVVLIGIGAGTFLLWEPHVEGRNVNATTFQIYFNDPFLAYAYLSTVPFFVAMCQAFRFLGFVDEYKTRSADSIKALRTIRRCAILFACLVGAAVAYLSVFVRGQDDIAGGVAMGLAMILLSAAMATSAAVIERTLQKK